MNLQWILVTLGLFFEHAVFVAITIGLAPTEVGFAALVLAWFILPAFTAAIAAVRDKRSILVASLNGLIAAAILDYLFLAHGYYWTDPPEAAASLAVAYVLFGFAISTGCGGFVHIVKTAMDRQGYASASARVRTAATKGFTFSTLCVLTSLPVLLLLLPAGVSKHSIQISVIYAIGLMLAGTVVASLVGMVSSETDEPATDRRAARGGWLQGESQ